MAESLIEEAPAGWLPPILADPPWAWEPIVLKGLEPPADPTVVSLDAGLRKSFMADAPANPSGAGTDWDAVAGRLLSGKALAGLTPRGAAMLYARLLVHGPDGLAGEVLADRRYWDGLGAKAVRAIVARHGLDAYPLALHAAGDGERDSLRALVPFLDAAVARIMIGDLDAGSYRSAAPAWFKRHGKATVPFVLPAALGEPGPERAAAETGLRWIVAWQGHAALTEAARMYGTEAVRASERLRAPEHLPEIGPELTPERLPRILLRGREHALPASAVRHLVTLLSLSTPEDPYPGLDAVVEACDPASLAEFAWALYRAESGALDQAARRARRTWASDGVRCALERMGDDDTADRLAAVVARWSFRLVSDTRGTSALRVFTAIGSDAALRRLDRLSRDATDGRSIRPAALDAMREIADRRGLTEQQLKDRLVPDFGLDGEGGKTLDYGPRSFRVGFDEQLTPYVVDGTGRHRTSLPKPGARDDEALATAAREHFAEMKKETRTIAADQIRRLEHAMVTGRTWTPGGFRALFLDHPLLRHIGSRLVWRAGDRPFRIAEDRSLADADDRPFSLPPGAHVTLAHPVHLGDGHGAWAGLFADYEILQPFPQLDRPALHLTGEEREGGRLARFEGAKVPNEPILGLPKRGWEWPGTGGGGRRWIIGRKVAANRVVVLQMEPGILLRDPDARPVQQLTHIELKSDLFARTSFPFGDLDPVIASEVLADLTHLTEPTGN